MWLTKCHPKLQIVNRFSRKNGCLFFCLEIDKLDIFEGSMVLETLLVSVNSHTCTEQKSLICIYKYVSTCIHSEHDIRGFAYIHVDIHEGM